MNLCRRFLTIIIAIFFIFVDVPLIKAADVKNSAPEGYMLAASTGTLELYYSEQKAAIAVMDLRSGHIWYSALPESEYPASNVTNAIKDEFNSLFILTYTQLNTSSAKTNTDPIMSLKPKVSAEKIENGIRLVYNLTDLNLSIAVEAIIKDDSLIVAIPSDKIKEGSGTDAQIKQKITPILSFTDFLKEEVTKAESDNKLDSRLRRDMKGLLDKINNLEDQIKNITSAVGINSTADNLLKSLNSLQDIYEGNATQQGIFTKIRLSSKLPDETKQFYTQELSDIDDALLPAKLATSLLKNIKVGSVIEIGLMPYFGAAGDNDEGYMLYPDGSGALTYFKKNHPAQSSFFKRDVYSDDSLSIDWEQKRDGAGIKRTLIPSFGDKVGNSAFTAMITDGDNDSNISFYPSGYVVNINRVFPGFCYRRVIATQNKMGVWQGGQQATMYEQNIKTINAKVQYMFLDGNSANYSGMAVRTKKNLTEQGQLNKSPLFGNGMPVGIDILGGVRQKILVFDRFLSMTKFGEASQVISELSNSVKGSLLVNLRGWTETGLGRYPSGDVPAKELGGERELKNLSSISRNLGVKLFLQDNLFEANVGVSGYKDSELTQGNDLRIVSSSDGQTMLLSPQKAAQRFSDQVLPKTADYGEYGMAFDRIGNLLYFDYTPGRVVQRADTAALWKEILESSQKKLGGAASIGGNTYVLAQSDWIQQVPIGASDYVFTDEDVPFYQMIVHGMIPYSSKAFNQFYDSRFEKLKAIEYGCIPYYSITYEDTSKLEKTQFNNLFSTTYTDLKKDMVDTINEFSTKLGPLANQSIISHERLSKDVVKMVYGDGSKVYINYSDKSVDVEGIHIEPLNYTTSLAEGGGSYEKTVQVSPEKILDNATQGKHGGLYIYVTVGFGILIVFSLSIMLFNRNRVQRH